MDQTIEKWQYAPHQVTWCVLLKLTKHHLDQPNLVFDFHRAWEERIKRDNKFGDKLIAAQAASIKKREQQQTLSLSTGRPLERHQLVNKHVKRLKEERNVQRKIRKEREKELAELKTRVVR